MTGPATTAAPTAACERCGGVLHPDDRFCEGCGARVPGASEQGTAGSAARGTAVPGMAAQKLAAPPSSAKLADVDDDADDDPDDDRDADAPAATGAPRRCRACGGTVAADGYCEQCGEPAASERDHWSDSPAPWVGGVCDRGVRHARNEDAMALAASGSFAALVVCDGVSTAPDSDAASLAAVAAARDVLVSGGPDGAERAAGSSAARTAAFSGLLARAAVAGNDAVVASMREGVGPDHAPSCTFVAAVVDDDLLVAGWLGDSRVYWLPDDGPAQQLTADDSWAGELMSRGVPREAAEASPQAHAITRWLGPDAEDVTARTTATVLDGPGWVLVCSDGLWNYCSRAEDLAPLLRGFAAAVDGDPARVAAELVGWANAQGGRDNVTVALARVPAPRAPAAAGTAPASAEAADQGDDRSEHLVDDEITTPVRRVSEPAGSDSLGSTRPTKD